MGVRNLVDDFEAFLHEHGVCLDGQQLIVCWSAGKDSTLLLSVVAEYARKKSISLLALMVPFPWATIDRDGYAEARQYWKSEGVNLSILEHPSLDPEGLPFHTICVACKRIRRQVLMEKYFNQCDLSTTVIATGHNTWDLAAYLTEVLLGHVAESSNSDELGERSRLLEVMNKFLPVYRMRNGPVIIRPLLAFGDPDVKQFIEERQIPFPFRLCRRPCPWRNQRKRILHDYFERMRLCFSLDKLERYAETVTALPRIEEYHSLPFETYLL